MKIQKDGPVSYRNWLNQILGNPISGIIEVPLYSDANIIGDLTEGLGPYKLRTGIPYTEHDPAAFMTIDIHLLEERPDFSKTNTNNYTGLWFQDEIAALISLAFGIRTVAGSFTRDFTADGNLKTIVGDYNRPTWFRPLKKRFEHKYIIPNAIKETSLKPDLLQIFPKINFQAATSLVRAARSYRDALWISEVEPELSWLLFVTAIEVAAAYHQSQNATPLEILRLSKPDLVKQLEDINNSAAELVAQSFDRELKSTGRFLSFMDRFMPGPPEKRPSIGTFDWSKETIMEKMKAIYKYRSLALHESVPFPPPMCEAPYRHKNEATPSETPLGLASHSTGGTWKGEDLPLTLNTFEYIARGVLINWWQALT